jgi:preprotein translocase subunit SecA
MLKMRGVAQQMQNAQTRSTNCGRSWKPGVVTIATNMAGRGTDIKLSPEVKAAGGLQL